MIFKTLSLATFFTLLMSSFVGNASPQQSRFQTFIVFEEKEVPQYESSLEKGKVIVRIVSPELVRKREDLDSKNSSGSSLRE